MQELRLVTSSLDTVAAVVPSLDVVAKQAVSHSVHSSDQPVVGEPTIITPTAVRMLLSTDLFGDSREVCIAHRGSLYRLRITMQNRLILQK